jgi:hypothetical protein
MSTVSCPTSRPPFGLAIASIILRVAWTASRYVERVRFTFFHLIVTLYYSLVLIARAMTSALVL